MCGAKTHTHTERKGGVLEIVSLIIVYLYMDEHIHA